MKYFLLLAFATLSYSASAQTKPEVASTPQQTKQIVEASCGQCQFKLKGNGCDLAVRINGKAYFVDGSKIDDHGDAHAKDGFCEAIRKAEVTGTVEENRFKATSFKLLPEEKKKE